MRKFLLILALVALSAWMLSCCSNTCELLYGGPQKPASKPTVLDKTHDRLKAAKQHRLFVGTAQVDITTKLARTKGIYLGGFDQGRRNTGVRSPIFAHCMYLDTGDNFVVFEEIDTIGMENPDILDAKALMTSKYADHIIINAAHDHIGPDTIGYWGPSMGEIPVCSGRVEPYMRELKHLMAKCVEQAAENARPARLRFGTAQAAKDLSRNLHYAIINQKDDTVNVMQALDLQGKSIGVMVNYGNHAESMWNSRQLGADWPGVMYNSLKDLGIVVFVQGALGGLVTVNPGRKLCGKRSLDDVFKTDMPVKRRIALRNKIGSGVAKAVRQALKSADTPVGPEGLSLKVVQKRFRLQNTNWVFEYMAKRGIIKRPVDLSGDNSFATDMILATVSQNNRVIAQFVSIPGEPAPTVFADLKAMMQGKWRFLIGLGEDEVGYMVRKADWHKPYYKYERTMSPGIETAPRIKAILKSLESM